MNQQEATEFVVRELDQQRTCDEIVHALCEQTSWPAKHVELFVQRVEGRYHQNAAGFVASPSHPQTQGRVEFESSAQAGRPATPQPAQPYLQHIAPEQYPEVVEAVISALGKHQSRKIIVRSLCEQHGWPWKQSHHFVQRVEIEHHGQIATRQSPLLIGLGIGGIVFGISMTAYGIYTVLNGHISDATVYYLGCGSTMAVAGIAGIWKAISEMRE
jgi:hypothetical protein